MARLSRVAVALALGLTACGSHRDGNGSVASGGPDAGTSGGGEPDAGSGSGSGGGGGDAGSGGGGDAGSGGGTVDAGSDGGGGVGGGGSVDGGSPGSGGGSDGGFGLTFPANQDPQFQVVRSSVPACDGIGPQSGVPAPVRLLRTFPSSRYGCGGGATGDGNGDVAFTCESYLPERGWNDLYSRDGSVRGEIPSWGLATPLSDGFIASYSPFGSHAEFLNFVWFDGGAWQTRGYADKPSEGHRFGAHAWRSVLVTQPSKRSTQWHDEHGNPLGVPLAWTYTPQIAGVDSLGNALILQNTPATAEGEVYAGWLRPDNNSFGWLSWRNPSSSGGDPLIGGQLIFDRSKLPGGAPGPAWLQGTAGRSMRVVNGGRAYAFTRADTGCNEPTVTVYAPDGTRCVSISLVQAQDPSCAQPAWLGVDGTLIQVVQTSQKDPLGYDYTIRRWWPRYLW